MSMQRGNTARSRPQKHKNRSSFNNTLHDTSHRTKFINNIVVSEVCQRCKEIIEWKIKYKKYKPLTQPKKCIKCSEKNVKHAYHVMCRDCGQKLKVCTKCCQSKEVMHAGADKEEQLQLDAEMRALLQSLPERKKRTFLRYMKKQECSDEDNAKHKDNLVAKLNSLKVEGDEDFDDDDVDFDSDD